MLPKPLILSLETSTDICSVALHGHDGLISYAELRLGMSHSSHLTPMIQNLMASAGIAMTDLDAIAVSEGPGSYTGLRIGVASAKGMAMACKAQLISVNTLLAMAHQVHQYNHEKACLFPMLDARRMEVYGMVLSHEFKLIEPTRAIILDETSLDQLEGKILVFGNGSDKCRKLYEDKTGIIFIDDIKPSAINIGSLAMEKFHNNIFEDIAYFEPFYLKKYQAKRVKN